MNTFYASPGRAGSEELKNAIVHLSNDSFINGLMKTIGGLLVVLNEHRQAVAINEEFIKFLNLDDSETILGLRLGEMVGCIHQDKNTAGCGTTEYCQTCGAAIATVSSLAGNKPIERTCAIQTGKNGVGNDLFFSVRAVPITLQEQQFILIFLQDISMHQRWAYLEKKFFHDLKNMLTGIIGVNEMMCEKYNDSLLEKIFETSLRMDREITAQQLLFGAVGQNHTALYSEVDITAFFKDLQEEFTVNHSSLNISLEVLTPESAIVLRTDRGYLRKVVEEMLFNAVEASGPGDFIKLWVSRDNATATIYVWNKECIPDKTALRVFQRNFSTKSSPGRGIGTFLMKLIGEQVLGGTVSFTSTVTGGTTFRITLPL
ncbi:HAMP domain-containing sensor histidine kinase [Chitinispirillales bacterium ANBcel5]|uniref:sensor histidine kinase n=1 Tax=Cellulosispirillum alkaliphilum TaxID=3039283 RepID=UPI002A52C61F|nr:HAMP domain-containing sensor histidine kinase [Chitinispirillales bacterium ANBcel5]